jgi:hypothetical protein
MTGYRAAMPFLRGHRKRQVATALVVAACAGLFTLQWHQAPRVETSPAVIRQLPSARGELYLGKTFEGLPLRTVDPFLYSDCEPGKKKQTPVPCEWVKVTDGRVTGANPKQVARARRELRPVG